MGTRSAERYAGAYNDLKDEPSARRFLGKMFEAEDVDRWVSNLRKEMFPAVAAEDARKLASEPLSPQELLAIEKCVPPEIAEWKRVQEEDPVRARLMSSLFVREVKRRDLLSELEAPRTRIVAQARALQTSVAKLETLFQRAEVIFPPPAGTGPPRAGESPEATAYRRALQQLQRGLGPFGPAEWTVAPLSRALASFIEGFTRNFTERKRQRVKKRGTNISLTLLVAANPSITGKALAALMCLASRWYPRSAAQAARWCKRWDTALTRVRPLAKALLESAAAEP